MIVRDITTIKETVGVNANFDFADIAPFVKIVERKFIIKLIGKDQYAIFNVEAAPTGKVLEALKLAQEAVSNLAYYLGLPQLTVQVTSAGIFVPENQDTRQATDKQFKELQRTYLSAGHEAIDDLLDFMETNKTEFGAWTADDSYTEFKDLLVYNTTTFQKEYNINNSRQTFLALVPNIKIVEDQYISGPVQADLLKALKNTQTQDLRKKVKALLIKSIVAFTINKTVDNGLFILSPGGIHLRFDVLPYERVVTNESNRINDFILNTKKSKISEGEEYLKQALAIITNVDNSAVFIEYTTSINEVDKIDLVKTQGIVGL